MPLEKLIARMEQRDTPDTPCNAGGVSREALCSKACTSATPDTPATDEDVARARANIVNLIGMAVGDTDRLGTRRRYADATPIKFA